MVDVLKDFADEFRRCWLCGRSADSCFPGSLQIHHICRGPHRQKSRTIRSTLVRTCPTCHEKHLDAMPVAEQLALKLRNDPNHYNPIEVNLLRGRAAGAIDDADVLKATLKLYAHDDDYPF